MPDVETWNTLAAAEAARAHESNFESRRGVFTTHGLAPDEVVLCVYDNNPYAEYPGLRDEALDALRVRLRSMGMEVVGDATYPTSGDDKGYTRAFIVNGAQDFKPGVADEVLTAYEDAVRASLARMERWPGAAKE